MAESSYWLWNGNGVEGPVTLSALAEQSASGRLLADAKIMAVDSQDWKTPQELGIAETPPVEVSTLGEAVKPTTSTELSEAKKPSLIEKIGAAFAALVVGLGAIIAGFAKLAVSVKGLFVATVVAAGHEGHALEAIGSDSRAEGSSSSSLFRPHFHSGHGILNWYWSHEALINETFLILLTVTLIIVLDRVLTKRTVIISKNVFRVLVGCSLLFLSAQIAATFLQPMPDPLTSFLNAPENSMPSSLAVTEAISLVAMLVSYVGLLLLKRWGRLLFVCSVSVVLLTNLSSGPLVEPASAQFFGTLTDLSIGLILALAYLTPVFAKLSPELVLSK